jgi:hypothetical protein
MNLYFISRVKQQRLVVRGTTMSDSQQMEKIAEYSFGSEALGFV